jgi:hypothetical protein
VGNPSTDEYWHIGEAKTRLRTVTPRKVSGEKSRLTRATYRRTARGIPGPARSAAGDRREHLHHRAVGDTGAEAALSPDVAAVDVDVDEAAQRPCLVA